MTSQSVETGLRDKINQRPQVVGAVVLGVLLLAAGVYFMTTRDTVNGLVSKMYYSDDDGKTWFADDTSKIYPFDHNGRQAYRAFVFQGTGQPYVAYLSGYTAAARTQFEQLKGKETDPANAAVVSQLQNGAILVKRPGDANWVPEKSAAGMKVQAVMPTDGSMVHQLVP